jgi:hypothetical protein
MIPKVSNRNNTAQEPFQNATKHFKHNILQHRKRYDVPGSQFAKTKSYLSEKLFHLPSKFLQETKTSFFLYSNNSLQ